LFRRTVSCSGAPATLPGYGQAVAVVANAPLGVPAEGRVALVMRPGFGAADHWIAGQAGPGDVVVTADIPLAARCLAKGASVLDPKGRPFTDNDIGSAARTPQTPASIAPSMGAWRDQRLVIIFLSPSCVFTARGEQIGQGSTPAGGRRVSAVKRDGTGRAVGWQSLPLSAKREGLSNGNSASATQGCHLPLKAGQPPRCR
jgi:hypothetical protein